MQTAMCPFCMTESQDNICTNCGRDIHYPGHPNHLPVGYVLQGRHTYVFGAAIGQGGFGITYIALDMDTNIRVAVKEYFPTHCCGRNNMTFVCSNLGQEDTFSKGKQHFILEAQMLQSLSDLDSVVKVLDYFEANNTAYLVMEYLDGLSLKDHVEQNGKLPAQEFLVHMKPLMADMEKMHQRGVVHRDIAPDNIILLKDGRLKLIDFGAARSYVGDKSMTVVVKKGFAPVEQYMRKGSNASTDVYALAATIYYCITGIVPPDSAERQYGEASLKAPTAMGAELFREQEKALAKALEIQPKDRTSSVASLIKGLYIPQNPPQSPRITVIPLPNSEKAVPAARNVRKPDLSALFSKRPSFNPKRLVIAAAAVAVLIGGTVLLRRSDNNDVQVAAPAAPIVSQVPEVTTPSPPETRPPVRTNVLASPGPVYELHKFWGQEHYDKLHVKTVRFLNSLEDVPSDAVDVSDAHDRSILMWMIDGNLTVAANGQISPNPNASAMFDGFQNLEQIDFGNAFDTSGVTDMSYMFQGCGKLTSLDLSHFDTSNVLDMRCMFLGCEKLVDLNLAGFDTSRVTDMNNMFSSCKSLKSPDVTDFHTGSVTNMDWMFSNCQAMTELDLSNYDTSRVTSFWGTFCNCKNLTRLDITSFNTSNTTSFNTMFANCESLTSLDVSSFDTSNATNMDQMFISMYNLKSLDVSNFDTSNVTVMSSMFANCHNLTSLDVRHFDTSSAVSMHRMFGSCHNLTELDLSNFDTSNVTDMKLMFYKNTNLKTLDLSSFDTSCVKDMSDMFNGCENLTSLDISNFDVSNVANMEGMFSGCKFPIPSWYKQ